MKVAAAQIRPFFAEPKKNRQLLSQYCEKAGQQEIDLLVFPELCVSGYNFTSRKQADVTSKRCAKGLAIKSRKQADVTSKRNAMGLSSNPGNKQTLLRKGTRRGLPSNQGS